MKRTVVSVFMVLAMTVMMAAGCGKGNEGSQDAGSGKSEGGKDGAYKVAFLPTDMSLTFASWLADELTTAF